ncbi:hypothetical protein KIN20_023672 [Parelaphostrongylus tenuis]|uniref:Uncharacterized protein n=1 Tax=Parelaphostrongylus tenuis TaxID=148309 RepID=A0AAD5QVH7_PARTN|nr:hypothetical protein KIN20_023672 [Parelaphostrongylus tenuis]
MASNQALTYCFAQITVPSHGCSWFMLRFLLHQPICSRRLFHSVRKPSLEAARLINTRGLSVSVNLLTPKDIVETLKRKNSSKGPAARRAGRRSGLLKSKAVAASTTNLDQLKSDASNLKWERRSMSVRDLNGEEFDFSNKDSVSRWTSQILAELDSLPSSCTDLTQRDKTDTFSVPEICPRFSPASTRNRASVRPPPVPPHRQSILEPMTTVDTQSANSKLMTSSARSGVDMTSSIDNVDSWIASFETFMTSSFHNPKSAGPIYSAASNRRKTITRDSEDSSTTFVVSLSDSNGDDTPVALTPLPTEQARSFYNVPSPTSSDRLNASAEPMSFSVVVNPNEACQQQLRPETEKVRAQKKPVEKYDTSSCDNGRCHNFIETLISVTIASVPYHVTN